jgi:hypothetical protein
MNLVTTLLAPFALAAHSLLPTTMSDTELAPGRVGGPGHAVSRVEAYSKMTYDIVFRGGELAQVVVDGAGRTDLDLFVYDENGHLIAFDDDPTDDCVATWTPIWTGRFRIEVRNLGLVSNRFEITTN